MLELVWLIPAFPLLGFILLTAFGSKLGEPMAGWLATIASLGSFISTVLVFFALKDLPAQERFHVESLFTWIKAGSFSVDMGFLADPLSITMCLFITGVGTLIHLYSIGYMHGDKNFSKFFVYLNLFVFSMLLLVLGDNLLLTFLGWEGVGACSYLLISFWFTDEANASAGKKAFVTNRVGDFGFMLATFLVFTSFSSINYADIVAGSSELSAGTATAIVLLFLLAASGKSAQLPLFVWLPDAMAGPTPVSALIHAATMVTSGVFLLTRLNPILAQADVWATGTIAWVGAITALVAATAAVAQNDIKKVLAYSTVSQLGYLFLAVGVGGYVAALFHMITHAFFKALLFLGSGSVIHGMHDEQDMRKMGGLKAFMPITGFTFILGWLAIAGVPPFSGFWSKDEILAYAWNADGVGGKGLWVIGLLTALLTAFYMTRQVILTFFGRTRFYDATPQELAHAHSAKMAASPGISENDTTEFPLVVEQQYVTALSEAPETDEVDEYLPASYRDRQEYVPHESPWTMTAPLVILAALSVTAGVINLPFSKDLHFLGHWLEPSLFANEAHLELSAATKWILAIVAIAIACTALAAAGAVYLRGKYPPEKIERKILADAWRIDSSYAAFFGGPGRMLFVVLTWFDKTVIDGGVRGVAKVSSLFGSGLRVTQSGYIRHYALGISVGSLLVAVWFVTRLFQ